MAIFTRQTRCGNTSFRIVGVNMYDWNFIALSYVTCVVRRAGILTIRRKTKSVVYDNMNRSTVLITGQLVKVKRFSYDTFTRECSISMHNNSSSGAHILNRITCLTPVVLRCASKALYNRIDELQVTRVIRKRDACFYGIAPFNRAVCAQMVFHIACPAIVNPHGTF
ncbi:hypothetical protein D3C73_477400 [compost metagenome]